MKEVAFNLLCNCISQLIGINKKLNPIIPITRNLFGKRLLQGACFFDKDKDNLSEGFGGSSIISTGHERNCEVMKAVSLVHRSSSQMKVMDNM